jgi:hypothetical protein
VCVRARAARVPVCIQVDDICSLVAMLRAAWDIMIYFKFSSMTSESLTQTARARVGTDFFFMCSIFSF